MDRLNPGSLFLLGAVALFTLLLLLPAQDSTSLERRPQRATAKEILRQQEERQAALTPAARAAYDVCRCRCGDGLCPDDDPNDPGLLKKLEARARDCGYKVCTMPEAGR